MAMALMGEPETNVGDLHKELGISRADVVSTCVSGG